jgi:isocitrate dehydrogenase kinase/phosphatase
MLDKIDLPLTAAIAIRDAFDDYWRTFHEITLRAKTRFEQRDWRGAQRDSVERLELYPATMKKIVARIRSLLGDQTNDPKMWAEMKAEYSGALVRARADFELAETFFNSITRRIFSTVGVDPSIEFVDSDFDPCAETASEPVHESYRPDRPPDVDLTAGALERILAAYTFAIPFADLTRDSRLAAVEIHAFLASRFGAQTYQSIDIVRPAFYRNKAAYLIGRVMGVNHPSGEEVGPLPLIICLLNEGEGVSVDAVLLDSDDASIVFSYTRSYFHADVERPRDLINFLHSILPLKKVAELYISIGFNKHGKTELYRDLLHHLSISQDVFRIAPGERGMVMIVFSLPSYDMVFKVIKDRIDPPKTTTRAEVMERYDLVFKHDRAGRLIDAQEFEHLSFDRSRFDPELLDELLQVAPQTVSIDGNCVVIQHLYTERRMIPLNLYVRQATLEQAAAAVLDYGQAIKDLASTNIFPGDVLLKNFGVTRHGRVVFYDYDELCLVTDCKFRKMPPPRSFDDEFEADAWFYVGPMDIFPEEFRTFLGLQEPLRSVFSDSHADLFDASYWKNLQARHRAGEVVDIFPYPESRRLHRAIRP